MSKRPRVTVRVPLYNSKGRKPLEDERFHAALRNGKVAFGRKGNEKEGGAVWMGYDGVRWGNGVLRSRVR